MADLVFDIDLSAPWTPQAKPDSLATLNSSPSSSTMSSEPLVCSQTIINALQPYLPPNGFQLKQEKRIHVTLTYAQSIDSRIAAEPGKPTVLSGTDSKAMTHYLRTKHDAILIGAGTAIADDPRLNSRLEGVTEAEQPVPIILDRHCRWSEYSSLSKVFRAAVEQKGKYPIMIKDPGALHSEQSQGVLGAQYVNVEGGSLRDVIAILPSLNIQSVMIEGGATVINKLLAECRDLIDTVVITIAPVYLGKDGVEVSPVAFGGAGSLSLRLQDVSWVGAGEDMVVAGRLRGDPRPQ